MFSLLRQKLIWEITKRNTTWMSQEVSELSVNGFYPQYTPIISTWNPNDLCFDWKGPFFGRFNTQNRGQTASRIFQAGYNHLSLLTAPIKTTPTRNKAKGLLMGSEPPLSLSKALLNHYFWWGQFRFPWYMIRLPQPFHLSPPPPEEGRTQRVNSFASSTFLNFFSRKLWRSLTAIWSALC